MADATPGPWKYHSTGNGEGGEVFPLPSEGEPVAVVNRDADGTLIAAAPDLRDALAEAFGPSGPTCYAIPNGRRGETPEEKRARILSQCGTCLPCRARAALARAGGAL